MLKYSACLTTIALLLSAPERAAATTFTSAFTDASVFVDVFSTFDPETGEEISVELETSGRSSVSAAAAVTEPNARQGTSDEAQFIVTNTNAFDVEIIIDVILTSSSDFFADSDEVTPLTRFDANGFAMINSLLLSQSVFSSVNGSYGCTNADFTSPSFDCFGGDASDLADVFDTPSFSLSPSQTVTFDLSATAFAINQSDEVNQVPLPPAGGLLLGALGLLALGRRMMQRIPLRASR